MLHTAATAASATTSATNLMLRDDDANVLYRAGIDIASTATATTDSVKCKYYDLAN